MHLTDRDFARLRDFMYQNYGINLEKKRTLIEGRLAIIVKQKGYDDFGAYVDNLRADKSGSEVSVLVSRLTTNFTYFMREEEHFQFLKDAALPNIVPKIRDGNLCIWSAGCSSGEEPYSLAMVLDDYFKNGKHGLDTKILATDISQRVLSNAVEGTYPKDRISRVSDQWTKKYFKKLDNGKYQVRPELKKEVIFREFNLMEPSFNFKRKFHVIFCRNVMIYFDNKTRGELAKRFYNALAPGGYLIIGLSETLVNQNTGFRYVRPSIYQK